jgi:hypothetical protein
VADASPGRIGARRLELLLPTALMLCVAIMPSPLAAQTALPRVRIGVGAIVEIAGGVHLEGQTAAGQILASDGDTVMVRSAGLETIKVPRPHRKVVGVLKTATKDVVTVVRADGSTIVVPREATATLERADGRRSRRRTAGFGFLIGAGGGAGIGYAVGATCHSTGFLGCLSEPGASALGGLILGGGAGALVGALIPPAERWVVVPADWLDNRSDRHAGPESIAQAAR